MFCSLRNYNYKRSTFNSRHKTKKADGHASKGQSWCEKQEAQQSPRDPRDALYQLKYCPTAVRKKRLFSHICLVRLSPATDLAQPQRHRAPLYLLTLLALYKL